MSPRPAKSFKSLQTEWYKKLKDSGFNDIEQDEDNLTQWSSSKIYRGQNNGASFEDAMLKREMTTEYYRLAGQFLHEHVFKNDKEKLIWRLHSEGLSLRDISATLKSNKDAVHAIVKPLAKIMLQRGKEAHE